MSKLIDVITIEDQDGEEHDIDVTIEYDYSSADPSVGIMSGQVENFSFVKSNHPHYSVAILNKMLDDKSGAYTLSDQVYELCIKDMENTAEAAEDYDNRNDD